MPDGHHAHAEAPPALPVLGRADTLTGGELFPVFEANSGASLRSCEALLERLGHGVQQRLASSLASLAADGGGGGDGNDDDTAVAVAGGSSSSTDMFSTVTELDTALSRLQAEYTRHGSERSIMGGGGEAKGEDQGGGHGGHGGGPMRKVVVAALDAPRGWAVRGRVDLAVAIRTAEVRDGLRGEWEAAASSIRETLNQSVARLDGDVGALQEKVAEEAAAAAQRAEALGAALEATEGRLTGLVETSCAAVTTAWEAKVAELEEARAAQEQKHTEEMSAFKQWCTALIQGRCGEIEEEAKAFKREVAEGREADRVGAVAERAQVAEKAASNLAAAEERREQALQGAVGELKEGIREGVDRLRGEVEANLARAESEEAALKAALAEVREGVATESAALSARVEASLAEGLERVGTAGQERCERHAAAAEASVGQERSDREAAAKAAEDLRARDVERDQAAAAGVAERLEEAMRTERSTATEWRQRLHEELRDLKSAGATADESRRQGEAALEQRLADRVESAAVSGREAVALERQARSEAMEAVRTQATESRGTMKDIEESILLVQTQCEAKVAKVAEDGAAQHRAAGEGLREALGGAEANLAAVQGTVAELAQATAKLATDAAAAGTAHEGAVAAATAAHEAAAAELGGRIDAAVQGMEAAGKEAREADLARATEAVAALEGEVRQLVAEATESTAAGATAGLEAGLGNLEERLLLQVQAAKDTARQVHEDVAAHRAEAAVHKEAAEKAVEALGATLAEHTDAARASLAEHADTHSSAITTHTAALGESLEALRAETTQGHGALEGRIKAELTEALQATVGEHASRAEALERRVEELQQGHSGMQSAHDGAAAQLGEVAQSLQGVEQKAADHAARTKEECAELLRAHETATQTAAAAAAEAAAAEAGAARAALEALEQRRSEDAAQAGEREAASRAEWQAALETNSAEGRQAVERAAAASLEAAQAAEAAARAGIDAVESRVAAAEAAVGAAAEAAARGQDGVSGMDGKLEEMRGALASQIGAAVGEANTCSLSDVDEKLRELRQGVMNEVAGSFADYATRLKEGLDATTTQLAASSEAGERRQGETDAAARERISELSEEMKLLVANARSEGADDRQQMAGWREDLAKRIHGLREEAEKARGDTVGRAEYEASHHQMNTMRAALTDVNALKGRVEEVSGNLGSLLASQRETMDTVRQVVDAKFSKAVKAMARETEAAKENAASLWESLGVISCRVTDVQTQVDNFS